MKERHFMVWVRTWLFFELRRFYFAFLQSNEFLPIYGTGYHIVMTLAIFLETGPNTYRWALVALSLTWRRSYCEVLFIFPFDFGPLYTVVLLAPLSRV